MPVVVLVVVLVVVPVAPATSRQLPDPNQRSPAGCVTVRLCQRLSLCTVSCYKNEGARWLN
jgi:hypothetical protein